MCSVTHGLPNVVLSFDGGDTFVYGDTPLEWGPHDAERHNWQEWSGPVVKDVVALDAPGSLVALAKDQLFFSEDYGCSWRSRGPADALRLGDGGGGFAHVWRRAATGKPADAPSLFAVTTHGLVRLPALPDGAESITAEPGHPRHLRLVGGSGRVFESTDRGTQWTQVGDFGAPVDDASGDPGHWEHLVVLGDRGPSVSRDGGRTWTRSIGFLPLPEGFSAGFVRFAHDGVVWLFSDRRVYRSTDGGLSFVLGAPRPAPYTYSRVVPIGGNVDDNVLAFLQDVALARFDAR